MPENIRADPAHGVVAAKGWALKDAPSLRFQVMRAVSVGAEIAKQILQAHVNPPAQNHGIVGEL
jgi:hypothetical protein